MAGADLATVRAALREHYVGKNLVDIFYNAKKDVNPMMAALEAVADTGEGGGRLLVTPIVYGTGTAGGQSFSRVLAKAQGSTVGSAGQYSRWETAVQSLNAVARWDRDAMDAVLSRSSKETFDVMTKEMDLKIALLRKLIATYSFGDGSGALGQITAVDSTTITVGLDVVNRIVRGADLVACTTTTGATKNSGTAINVTAVDYSTGICTMASDPTASTAWAVNDYVFNYNDRPNASIATYANQVMIHGMKAWLPGGAVVDSTTFDGVTRNGNSDLAGLTVNCASLEPEDAFTKSLTQLFVTGGQKADALFCNPYDYSAFTTGKDKSKTVQIELGKYNLGFSGFNVETIYGSVPVVPDAMCPAGEFYAGPWKDPEVAPRLVYVGDLVQIDNKDGMDFVRAYNDTAYEMRLYFRGNIICPAPGRFVRGYGLTIA